MSPDSLFFLFSFGIFLAVTIAVVRWTVTELDSLGLRRWPFLLSALVAPQILMVAFGLRSLWVPILVTSLLSTGFAGGLARRPPQKLGRYLFSAAAVAACGAYPAFVLTSAQRATEMGKLGILFALPLYAGLAIGTLLGAQVAHAQPGEPHSRWRTARPLVVLA
ncbi:MAG: hypothetical protein M3Y59_12405, partial [Myxococcota bacterium]|nr:hypothetical protein [Myxococcota bacterium]